MTITATDARKELAERELARRHLSWYWKRAFPDMVAGAWQLDLCKVLQEFVLAVERRESPRLIIEAPPQHGKSMFVSRALPAWLLGNHPDWNQILASYTASLATGHGRWIRNTLATEWHGHLFPASECRLAQDSAAMDQFSTLKGGQFLARGVGGGTTGQPARIFTVDDPFADRQEADSAVTQKTVWDWYSSVASTRLAPGGGILIMNTRWHLNDLVGQVLDQARERPDGDQWRVVTYPALAVGGDDRLHRESGEALHPERYSTKELLKKKASMIPRDWMALYQQSPVSDAGGYFQRSWFRSYTETPKVGERAIACDFAYRTKEENDYTCCWAFGMTEQSDLAILPGAFMERLETDKSIERLLDLAEATKADALVTGRDALSTIGPFLRKRMDERRISFTIHEMPERVDIQARARPLQGRMQMGKVLFPAGDLLETLIKPQYLSFPAAKHDDAVSCGVFMCWLLDTASEYRQPAPSEWVNPDEKRWKERGARNRKPVEGIPPLFGSP